MLRSIGFGVNGEADGVLLFKPDRIGDFVMATGALHLLCRHFSAEKITLMVSEITRPLAEREFRGCRIVAVPLSGETFGSGLLGGWLAARRAGTHPRYRHVVNLRHHPTLYEDLLLGSIRAWQSFAARRNSFGNEDWHRSLRTFTPTHDVCYPSKDHSAAPCLELEAHRRLTEAVLGRSVDLAEVFPRLNHIAVSEGDYLLIAPYGSSPIRTYPENLLLQAVAEAELGKEIRIVICGEKSQEAFLERLGSSLRLKVQNRVEVVLPGTLTEFTEWIARASCVLSMESAGAHLAAALDKRAVLILGGGHFGYFAPWVRSARQRWVFHRMPCYGCDWQCCQPYIQCIHDISATEVAAALREAARSGSGTECATDLNASIVTL
jgi:ADP-heptose:LPS heptosyltransferase